MLISDTWRAVLLLGSPLLFLGSFYKKPERENEPSVSEEASNITNNSSVAFDAKDDKAFSGFPALPSRRARWFYPFDFQDQVSHDSRKERLLSLLLDWVRR